MKKIMRLLKMIEDGVITSEEGLKLIEVIEDEKEFMGVNKRKGKWIKVKVNDGNDTKVNVNIPVDLAKLGIGIASKYVSGVDEIKNIDFDEIIRLIEEGAEGKIVEVEDGEILVELYVE